MLAAAAAMFAAILRASSRVSAWPQCLLYPQKRTSLSVIAMSALCQKRTMLYGRVMSAFYSGRSLQE
jgi:hypothetical protein